VTASEIQARVVGATAVIGLDGELDRRQAGLVRRRLLDAAPPDVVALLLDLGAVEYLDSAGVHLLLDLDRELRGRGQALHLVRPQRRTPAFVLEVTDVGDGIPVHADLQAALVALEPDGG
jgi:anti-sigma B factor antagonist